MPGNTDKMASSGELQTLSGQSCFKNYLNPRKDARWVGEADLGDEREPGADSSAMARGDDRALSLVRRSKMGGARGSPRVRREAMR